MALNGGLSVGAITYVNGSGVRVRDAAVSGDTLYTITNGDRVEILAKKSCSDGYYWYRIDNLTNSSKPNGWIRGDFLRNSSGSSGSNDNDDDSVISGVTGNGPNSTVSSNDIRNGNGVWRTDTKTSNHPGIKNMQEKLNIYSADLGVGSCGYADGCFGDKTAYMVRWFQGVINYENGYSSPLTQDGIVGEQTIEKMDLLLGRIV